MASQLMLTKTDKSILPRCSSGDSLSLFYMHKYFVLIWYISWSWEHLHSPDWACTAQIRQAVRAEAEYTNGAPQTVWGVTSPVLIKLKNHQLD